MSHLAVNRRRLSSPVLRLLLAYLVLASALPVPAARAVQQTKTKATPAPVARKSEQEASRTASDAKDRVTTNALQAAGKIAFVGGAADNEVFVMNSDGSEQTNLTNNPAIDENPTWSPDGQKLAFVSDRDGEFEIFLMGANGSSVTQITSNAFEDVEPAWSPDGSKLAFQSNRDGNDEIYLMNADGTNQVRLTNNAVHDGRPAWSPDGSKLVFQSDRDGNRELYSMNADGSTPVNLTNDPAFDASPAWSPDGSKIAFASNRAAGDEEIFTINADGTNATRLTNSAGFDTRPTWSPDNTKVAFNSTRTGTDNIFVMNANGTGQTQITNDPNGSAQADWQTLLSCAPPPPNGVAWYRAEENANDSIGTNHGTLRNGAGIVQGFVGSAFSLDGTDDYVEVPDDDALRPATFTLEGWIKSNAFYGGSGGNAIISHGASGTGLLGPSEDSYLLYLFDGRPGFATFTTGTGSDALLSATALNLNQWYHIAATFDGTKKTIYVNGTQVATNTVTGSIVYETGLPVLIGQDLNQGVPSANVQFNGLLDEITIYNSALTQTQIKNIFDAKNEGKCLASAAQEITVSNTNSFGPGSLRQAIIDANASPGTQTIDFNIPGAGVHTINLTTPLPDISDPVIIDGYTQPGSSANTLAIGDNAVLLIELNGMNAFAGGHNDGLRIVAGGSTVRGLVINRFVNGIHIMLGSNGNTITGNFIGTDAAGTADFGNNFSGVRIDFSSNNNTVGGTTPAARNIISGNEGFGVRLKDDSSGNTVQGNYVGTDKNGTASLGNTGAGIVIQNNSNNNLVGGTGAGEANTIAFNGNDGVLVETGTGNRISGNSIHSNGTTSAHLGIDLGTDGVTPNDAGDADSGANNLQNFPVLASAMSSGGNTTITGTLNSTANTQFQIEFFSNPTCDASGNGEGRTFIGSTSVTTDGSGNANINAMFSGTLASGASVTATAIDPAGNTSEFSACQQSPVTTITVSNTNDSGAGSLRQAIFDSNTNAGVQTINFNIAGAGVKVITLASALPDITQTVIIDATTQPDYQIDAPQVELRGAGAVATGLAITAGNSTVKGFILNGFTSRAILLQTGGTNKIQANFIGTNAAGTGVPANQNFAGVVIDGSPNNLIGGDEAGERNVISANDRAGVSIVNAGSNGNTVSGNYIGTDKTGTADLGNFTQGISMDFTAGGSLNVGGLGTGEGNVIAGNNQGQVYIGKGNSTIRGNYIGTDKTGTACVGSNNSYGIQIQNAATNTVGGDDDDDGTADGTVRARNIISCSFPGIDILGNNLTGVATDNIIRGNYIGTDVTGTVNLGNVHSGIRIRNQAVRDTQIGGTTVGAGNLIAFTTRQSGIVGGNGITISDADNTDNTILGNSIHSNALLGIDLGGDDAISANDAGDADTGPNRLQNFPVLSSATTGAGTTTVAGTLNSTPSTTFRIEFFSNPACDASNSGEGQVFLGSQDVTTDASGNATINATLGVGTADGHAVTATATNTTTGDTSEFSACQLTPVTTLVVTTTADSGVGSLRQAILDSNLAAGVQTITFNISGAGVKTIALTSALPAISQTVIIDGATQPGYAGQPLIELNGAGAGAGADGFQITAANSTIRALAVNRFGGQGIEITGEAADGNTVEGCYIGTDATGTTDLGNTSDGVLITLGADNNTVGGSTMTPGTSPGNVISGNGSAGTTSDGIEMNGASTTGNTVRGNIIGLNAAGTTALRNEGQGVFVNAGASTNGIGSVAANDRNVISGNFQNGIEITGSATVGNTVRGNYIGTDIGGTLDRGNLQRGIHIDQSSSANVVGGSTATPGTAPGNVVSGNDTSGGIQIRNSAANNQVQGNLVGTNAAGTAALGNTGDGVVSTGANNIIGGATADLRNVISGNTGDGIEINGAGAIANTISSNYIGTDISGTADLGNTGDGVRVTTGSAAATLTVGGLTATPGVAPGNVISGNQSDGIEINGLSTVNVIGNIIGLQANGTTARRNETNGILITGSAGNTVGGYTTTARNIIAAHNQGASHGLQITGEASDGNKVVGNYIGTGINGTEATLGNGGIGVLVTGGADNNIIGGDDDDDGTADGNVLARNVIVRNGLDGVALTTVNTTTGNVVQGNFIGVGADAVTALGNTGDGIEITGASNTVGGTTAGAGNLIANSGGDGVLISSGTNQPVQRNSIHSNGGLGIDLGANGVQANDALDPDTGANNLQNYPVLTSVSSGGGTTTVNGTFNSTANTAFTIDFYSNMGCDASGNGEGRTFIGSTVVNTDGSGNATISATLPGVTLTTEFVTATATDPAGNTSEFSACQQMPISSVQVTNTNDTGAGSLRQAILDSNAFPGVQTVQFNITGAGPHTITPTTALPDITQPVIIDGYTQPGASANTLATGNDAVLLIELNGATAGGNGLNITGGNSIVRGLAINRFGTGVRLATGGTNTVEGCFLGTDPTGNVDLGNGNGLQIISSSSNTVGGTSPAARNLISGNNSFGIEINGGNLTGNLIRGNYIGTTPAGTAAIPNLVGVSVGGTPNITNNTVGGATAGAGNLISGNTTGLQIGGSPVTGTVVQGNIIGLKSDGLTALANTGAGITVSGSTTQIGGTTPEARNVVSGNGGNGITITGANNTVLGNYIGTNAAGTAAVANGQNGLDISATGNTVGGTAAGAGNVISANGARGIILQTTATGAVIQGNFIGTDKNGTVDLGNMSEGISFTATGVVVGGATAAHRNVISGNNARGITIGNSGSFVRGNYIGVAADGTTALGNTTQGIFTSSSASNSTIGGTAAGEGNVIAFNGDDGVQVANNGTGHSILGNSIHSNGTTAAHLGIDLGTDGVTPNDANDPDTGANNLQNFPVLSTVMSSGGNTTITGTLNSTASTTFRIEFFSNPTCDASFNGEGSTFLGTANVTTDASGNASINETFPVTVTTGHAVTATATNPANSTSEFSACRSESSATLTVSNTNDSGAGSLRQAIIDSNVGGGVQTIAFNIGTGAQTVALTTPLPAIIEPVVIDGTTQPGYAGQPLIELNGAGAGAGASGLTVTGGSSTVKALVINRFTSHGILLQTAGGNTVEGCYIGTDGAGATDLGNGGDGIRIENGSANNIVGGMTGAPGTSPGNIISGNNTDGIEILGATSGGNTVRGNLIGLAAGGNAALGNTANGIFITAPSNVIGGANAQARNIISGNTGGTNSDGVELEGDAADLNVIAGNYIGTNITGTVDLGNGGDGIRIDNGPDSNTVGGLTSTPGTGLGNVISGNTDAGVEIADTNSVADAFNLIQGNLIGLRADGAAALRNENDGVRISSAAGNTIGGANAQARNIISGHNQSTADHGIEITGEPADNNLVAGNFIGTDIAGTTAIPNGGDGVNTNAAGDNTTVGGATATPGQAPGNVISGNAGDGIHFSTGGGHIARGNIIGLNAAGTAALPNAANGVFFNSVTGSTLGGATADLRNVISGNGADGVMLDEGGGGIPDNNLVAGNYIGTDITGLVDLGNVANGIQLGSADASIVGGAAATPGQAPGNVISGNNGDGIEMGATTTISAFGNLIGLKVNGTEALPNSGHGVLLSCADTNTVGGAAAGERNIISGNAGNGVFVTCGNTGNATGNVFRGNYIGTNAAGTAAVANLLAGIRIEGFANTHTVGGTAAGAGNLISGNAAQGILLGTPNGINAQANLTTIQGNRIGTQADGVSALGNGSHGVEVNPFNPANANNTIGGTSAGAANTIAFNAGNGVRVANNVTRNLISANSVHSNTTLGIDLGAAGVTANDAGDADTGANTLQNFPVLTSVMSSGGNTTIAGTLNSTANTQFIIEFFSSPSCDASGNGEGKTFIGSTTVTTDGSGNAAINTTLAATVSAGEVVTATATDPTSNTSEFSQCVNLAGSGPTLGNYPDTSVQLSANATVTPSAAPVSATSINVSTSTNFKGRLEGDPATGVVRVTDAHPAGTYTVTVTAFDGTGATATKTFTLTVTTPVTCNPVIFAAAANYGVGSEPFGMALGDFNRDGKQDLITTNAASNNVSVLLGDGAGNFGAATNFNVAGGHRTIAVGDFNGDGKQDVATNNLSGTNVSVLLGDGAGSFGAATNYTVGNSPWAIAVADFNGDGKQDLAVTNSSSSNVSVLLGDGAGSFGAATNFNTGNSPRSVVIGDFNSDGKQDVAAANFGTDNVSVLLGDGAGGLGAATNFNVGDAPVGLSLGDFNNDGNQDLVTVNQISTNAVVLLGDGAGSFSTGTGTDTVDTPFGVAVGDFNGDGTQDLAVNRLTLNDVLVLLGDGTGGFGGNSFNVGSSPASVVVGDFNGDGKQDVAAANNGSNNVSVLLRQCPPPTSFTVTNTNDSGAGSLRQAILDSNTNAGTQTINFNIAGAGPHTIQPTSALPNITQPVIIDGYTQPGASANTLATGNDATLLIVLNGASAGVVTAALRITGGGSTVRGLVINNFTGAFPNANGIQLNGGSGSVIEGNFIGTNAAGTAAVPNGVFAVDITNSTNNRVGGTTPAARNVLSGNSEGVHIFNSNAAGNNLVQGNYIGMNAAGTAAIPNTGDAGIRVTASQSNTVGGTAAGAGNVISGNNTNGISIDTNAHNNTVQGNLIGTNASAASALANTSFGIVIAGSNGNVIGGTAAGAGNVIANSGQDGVAVQSGTGNLVSTNSIFANSQLGIDLGTNGVATNDAGDADAGANNLQNYPVLTSVMSSGGTTTITGTLNSTASTQFTIEFFSNASCDASSNGEGRTFIGSTSVTTDGAGNATINATPAGAVSVGEVITATATDPAGNTSEFSACRTALAPISVNLALTMSDSPDPVTLGNNVTYTATVTNNGPDAATGVVVTDTLPANTNFVSANASQGSCNAPSGGVLTCNLGGMANAAQATVTVVVTPTQQGTITNQAAVAANEADPDNSNNSASATTTVNGLSSNVNWINAAGGSWNVAANWQDGTGANRVPGAGDNAIITLAGTYTVTLASAVTVGTLNLGAASGTQTLDTGNFPLTLDANSTVGARGVLVVNNTLTGAGNLDVSGTLAHRGTLSGAGTVNIAFGATLDINGNQPVLSRTLNNSGTTNYAAVNSMLVSNGTFNNLPSGIFNVQSEKLIFQSGGTSLFFNRGTVRKLTGAGTMQFNLTFNNEGTVDLQSGALNFSVGGTSAGQFNGAANTTFEFSNQTLLAASSVNVPTLVINGGTNSIAGTYNVTDTSNIVGTVTITGPVTNVGNTLTIGGRVDFNSNNITAPTINVNGVLAGSANVTTTATGTINYNGSMLGTGTTDIPAGATLNITGSQPQLFRTVNNSGTAVYNPVSSMVVANGTLNNLPGALFDVRADKIMFQSGGAGTFNNQGTLRKTQGAGTTDFSLSFNNTGTVEAQSGSLSFNAGGTSSGSFNASAGNTLTFNAHTLQAASSVSAPNVNLQGTTSVAGTYNVTGTTTVTGTVTFTGNIANVGNTLTITGQANFNSNNITAPLINVNGTLSGSANVSPTAGGTFNFNGALTGTGTTDIPMGATLNIGGSQPVLSRTLNNSGTTIFNVTNSFVFSNGTFNNLAGSTFDLRADKLIFASGGTNAFNNAGTLRKTQGAGTADFNLNVATSGTVESKSGTLGFNATYNQSAGVTRLDGGNLSTTSLLNIQGGTLTGTGTVTGNVQNAGTLAPGLSAGILNITGNYTQLASGILLIEIGGTNVGTQYDQLNVSGTATLDGTLNTTLTNGFNPGFNNQFVVLTYGARSGTFATITGAFTPAYNANNLTLTSTAPPPATLSVTTTADSGAGSLRQAMLDSNATAGTQAITFNIAGAGVQTIKPLTPLPILTDPVIIDGYTQPGASTNTLASGNDAVLLIELDGSLIAGGSTGLRLRGGGSVVRGLVVNLFNGSGITLETLGNNTVEGNFIGMDADGTTFLANSNGTGLDIVNSPSNLIGGATPASRNIISGNRLGGLNISEGSGFSADDCIVQGNYIGTDKSGTAALGNASVGISITGATNTLIGGATTASRNLISANARGINIFSDGNRVQGNYIGTDASGTLDLGNGDIGVFLQSVKGNQIGGATATAGQAPGNLISGNNSNGIALNGSSAPGNTIQGNLIGTNAAGTAALANGSLGIGLLGDANTVGGTNPQARNVISGNGDDGIAINGQNNVVQGNFIGTDLNGASALANNSDGVFINSQNNNTVGGDAAGAGNRIAFNTGVGVRVSFFNNGFNNSIVGNSIFSNGGLGIDLGASGVTANDAGDADTGANNLQNFPVVTVVTSSGGNTTFTGTLNSMPNTSYLIHFYSNAACDASGSGEGQTYLGNTLLTTNGAGEASFNTTLNSVTLSTNDFVTATATDPANNTSEFSACRQVSLPVNTFTIGGQVTEGANGLSGVTMTLSGTQSATTTTDANGNYAFANLPANGNYTVTPSRVNYTFNPPSRAFNNLSANQTGNFAATLNTYTLSGRISDSANANLAGVTVTLSGSQSATTTTDANGNYSFANLAAGGNYTITPSLSGYTFAPPSRTVNNLSANQTGLDFTGTLNAHTISGQITENGNALAGVTVTLSGSQNATTTTDANGNYAFNASAGGNYTVTPSLANYTFNPPSRSFNNLSSNQTGNFAATRNTHSIGGQIRDNNNQPLSVVTVTLSGGQAATTTTDAGGNYSFANLPAGANYTVTPARTGYSFAPTNATFNNLNANQTANFTGTQATYTISGRVRDTLGANLGGVTVTLSGAQSRTVTTAADGLYTFANLPQGAYTVTPALNGYAFNPSSKDFPNLTQNESFDFTGTPSVATPAGANVQVIVGGFSVTFTVVNNAGTTNAPPINPATAGALPAGYILFGGSRAADITTTATYTGVVTVCTNAPTVNDAQTFANLRILHGENGVLVDRTSGSDFNTRTVCGQVNTLSPFVLAQAIPTQPQTVNGTVKGPDGAGLSNVTIVVTDANTGVILTTTTTNASGNYNFALPPGGDYTVTTAKAGFTFQPAARTFGNLSGGQTSDFTATKGLHISGRVAGPTGSGVGNVVVTLSGSVSRATLTLPNGSFLFTNLPASGDYVVQADSGLLTFSPPQVVRPGLSTDVTLSLVATPRPVPVPTPPIAEDFSGTTRDPSKFTEGTLTQPPGSRDKLVTVVQQNGQLVITPRDGISEASFNGYATVRAIDFTDATASVEIPQTADNGAQTIFAVGRDERNYFRFVAQDIDPENVPAAAQNKASASARSLGLRRLIFQARNAGVLNGLPTSIPYDSVRHRFWRFRHDSSLSVMFFETSPDRAVWTEQRRVQLGGPVGLLSAELSAGTNGKVTNAGQAIFDNLLVQPSTTINRANNIRLSQGTYRVSEGAGLLTLKAVRAGDTSRATTIDYATEPFDGKPCNASDGKARVRCDIGTTAGTINFAPGETEKTFSVFITDDTYAEGDETLRIALGFPSAGVVEEPSAALVTIADNDGAATPNPINTAPFMVRQQYLDFLNREPDTDGFNAWVGVLRRCAFEGHFGPGKSGSDPNCDRITVSSAFFRSTEFSIKGFFVYRFYKASLGRLPTYEEFLRDMTSVTGQTEAEVVARREAFANAWVERADFVALNEGITNAEYVEGLAATAGVPVANSAQMVTDLNSGKRTRAQVLRAVVDSPELFNREYNSAFVLMQYFGYLQRDPDEGGFNSWLSLLDRTGDYRTMIFGFLYSQEYISRFGTP